MNSFLQSSAWLDFQKSLGRKVWQIGSVNIFKHNLPFGKSYFYSPRYGGDFLSESFLSKIREIAKQENAIFFKIEPLQRVQNNLFRKSTNIQPQRTLILNITKSEQELLDQMHYKTRYNIQLAHRRGVAIKKQVTGNKKQDYFEDFWKLMRETTKRDGFHPHPKEYYRKMLEIPGIELFIAEFGNKIIAANIVVFYEKQAIYLHGASDYEHRNLMAPHLLQWEQIKEAKKHRCIEYDFWGIDEKRWPGVTRFKRGFGGMEIIYPNAHDLVFQPIWYKIYKIARKIL